MWKFFHDSGYWICFHMISTIVGPQFCTSCVSDFGTECYGNPSRNLGCRTAMNLMIKMRRNTWKDETGRESRIFRRNKTRASPVPETIPKKLLEQRHQHGTFCIANHNLLVPELRQTLHACQAVRGTRIRFQSVALVDPSDLIQLQ